MNRIYYIAVLSIILFSCNEGEKNDKSQVFSDNKAKWIQIEKDLPEKDSLFYQDDPSPLFRKKLFVNKKIKEAKLYITSAGYNAVFINDKRVGKNILDPAWTDYSKRIYYTEYDVIDLLTKEQNVVNVMLGNGFYNPLPLKMWGWLNLRNETNVGKPKFILKLIITYVNGDKDEIVSDSSWKYSFGPIVRNSVYLGSHYDARNEIKGWQSPNFDDSSWNNAQISQSPGGIIEKAFFPGVEITKEIEPVNIYEIDKKKWIVDMGENFTGTYKIKLSGKSGEKVSFRLGERVYDDGSLNPMTAVTGQIKRKGVGGSGAPEIAWQAGSYIFGDELSVWYRPEFTYHSYRYLEIEGLQNKPKKEDIKGLFIHSNVKNENNLVTSSDLLNLIQEAVERTFLSNLVSVQSDCPAREKFGYGGDINATSESYIYNFDMHSMYRKTIYDWVDAMNDSVFVDTAPYVGIKYCGLSWESSFLITQYYLYLYYNDIDIIKELFSYNNLWMEKVSRIHPEGFVDAGLSDHESLEPVPVELTGTLHYLQSARIMELFSKKLGYADYEKKYNKLAIQLKDKVKSKFWDNKVEGNINRQTLFSSLLYHDIISDDEINFAKDSLLKAIKNGPSGHFSTGIFGTKYILETISKYISPQIVYDIVNSTEYPGWGYMIHRGATSIWETWKESDNVYSNSHPMFGVVTEWYYRWLGGIRPHPDFPGFKKFFLNPYTPDGLNYVRANYQSPYGKIISNWEKSDNIIKYDFEIPNNTVAHVSISMNKTDSLTVLKSGLNLDEINDFQDGEFTLSSGIYTIKILKNK